MKLSSKTFCYSILLSGIIVSIFICYLVLLFPSLYVAHIQNNNYSSAVSIQKQYVKERSYLNIESKNPTNTITVDIPFSGNDVIVVNNFFMGTITITDSEFLPILDRIRYIAKHPEEMDENTNIEELLDIPLLKEKFEVYQESLNHLPFTIAWETSDAHSYVWDSNVKVHPVEDNFFISESSVTQGENSYTTYLAITVTEHSIVMTIMSVVNPHMKDVMPVVISSLPMIVTTITLLVLLLSQLFSKVIITPIIRLSKHAEYVKIAKNREVMSITLRGNDEIASLGRSLNELYERLRENYKELEDNNKILSLENERQEVFLRAFSHQLKTPLSSSLLLVQGMYEEVGKYKDTNRYLPEVKKQLLSMQKIIEDIIYLNYRWEQIRMEELSFEAILDSSLRDLELPIAQKNLRIEVNGSTGMLNTSSEMLKIIIDNLLSNGVLHTSDNGCIRIIMSGNKVEIINEGAWIQEELLLHIFEPFVTSNDSSKGHGLGLYIVKYYAQCLNYDVSLCNISNGVKATVVFQPNDNPHLMHTESSS